jgi:hypothetical protein
LRTHGQLQCKIASPTEARARSAGPFDASDGHSVSSELAPRSGALADDVDTGGVEASATRRLERCSRPLLSRP